MLNEKSVTISIKFIDLLIVTLGLAIVKLLGWWNISWWTVTAPIWILPFLSLCLLAFALFLFILALIFAILFTQI